MAKSVITIKMDDELITKLKAYCMAHRIKVSAFVEMAVRNFLFKVAGTTGLPNAWEQGLHATKTPDKTNVNNVKQQLAGGESCAMDPTI